MSKIQRYSEFVNEGVSHPAYYPALEIDNAIGTKLHTVYKMPGGISSDKIERSLVNMSRRNRDTETKKLYKQLVKLNPDLGIARDEHEKWDVVFGATSGYPLADIKYFSHDMEGMGFANVSDAYRKKVNAALGKVEAINNNYHGGYLPSPASLAKIEAALKAHKKS